MRRLLLLCCLVTVVMSYLPFSARTWGAKRRSCRSAVMETTGPEKPKPIKKASDWKEAERLAENAANFFGGIAKAAEDAAESWVNSGWQVKKRAGQVIPEIRPNAEDVTERVTPYLSPAINESKPVGLQKSGGSSALATPQADALQVSRSCSEHPRACTLVAAVASIVPTPRLG